MLMFGGAADLSSGRFVGAGSSRDISVAGNSDRGAESLLHAPEKNEMLTHSATDNDSTGSGMRERFDDRADEFDFSGAHGHPCEPRIH